MRALAAALLALSAAAAAGGTVVLKGGAIYTLDPAHPWAGALAIRDGRIAYVGNDAERFETKDARIVALHGRMVLPGFHDAHSHPMSGAMRLLRCRLDGGAARIAAQVRACAKTQKGPWLLGAGWPPKAFAPTTAKLDALVPDRPAFLTTQDGFIGWANTKALDAAGIARAAGALTPEQTQRVRRAVPPPGEAAYREAFARASAIANGFGITSVFDAAATPALLAAYRASDRAGALTLRVAAAQRVDVGRGPEQAAAMIAWRERVRSAHLSAGAAKIFLDEEVTMHTAALLAPYADAPSTRGTLFVAPARLDALVQRLDAAGFDLHMHAMGDLAARAGLDAIERAARANGARDRRHQLAHLAVVDPADAPRFGRLGVTSVFTPLWARPDDPAYAATVTALGPKRARWMYPIARIAAQGGRIAAGSDWMSTPMNPLESIAAAMTRGGGEAMPLAAMIAAYTTDAAWAAREDGVDGTLAAGKAADLVVLDRNLFAAAPAGIAKAHVLLTLLDGRPVYRDPSFAW